MVAIGEQAVNLAKTLAKQTKFGKRLVVIKNVASKAKAIALEVKPQKIGDIFVSAEKAVKNKGAEMFLNLSHDKSFTSALETYSKKINIDFSRLSKMGQEELLEIMVESGAVGPNKFLQIISSDKDLLSQLSTKAQEIVLKSRSENKATRVLPEAQGELSALFSGGGTLLREDSVLAL